MPFIAPMTIDSSFARVTWGTEEDEGHQTFNPLMVGPEPGRFSPNVGLFMGRRNAGKSLSMTIWAGITKHRYQRFSPYRKVFTNYKCSFADRQSPVLLEEMMMQPAWSRNALACFDETQLFLRSRRSMSQSAVHFTGGFITQIRKKRVEPLFVTQIAGQIDKDLLVQVDLFIDVEQLGTPEHLLLKVYDWWGQYTGNRYYKRWPPSDNDVDFAYELLHDGSVFKLYDTDQEFDSIYLPEEERARILASQWAENEADYEELEGPMAEAQRDVMEGTTAISRPNYTFWDSLPGRMTTGQMQAYLEEAVSTKVVPEDTKIQQFIELLSSHGYTMKKGGGGYIATKAVEPV